MVIKGKIKGKAKIKEFQCIGQGNSVFKICGYLLLANLIPFINHLALFSQQPLCQVGFIVPILRMK